MRTPEKRKHTHSRYNRERWISHHGKNRKSFHLETKRDVSLKPEKIPENDRVRNQKKQEASLDRQVLKSRIINQTNHIESSEEQLKRLKKHVHDEKKELHERKKSLRKAEKEKKKAEQNHHGIPTSVLVGLLFTFSVLVLASALWLYGTWPNLKMDELVYEATSPLQGTGGGMISKYLLEAVLPAGIALIAVILILIRITQKGKRARKIGKHILCAVSAVCLAISGISFWNRLDVGTYLKNQNSTDDFIASEYVDPADTEITFPQKKRNLIYIYLESMEMTYADPVDGGAFPENVIPELTDLSEKNENFSGGHHRLNGAHSLPGTTWTMGGMFAATSGLPLQISIGNNNMDTQKSFFPGLTTIGNILQKQGYQNIFECGSDGKFGGRQLYYQTHGNYEIHDINYYKKKGILPQDYHVWWGFEDKKLIRYAKEELRQLGESGQPFNYTMLTVDTHFEDGYVCDLCRDDFPGNQYANVMACSSRQISELISWIQQQPWYENTTIVLSGDHPTMDKDFCQHVDSNYQRRVYTAYINADPLENKSEGYRDYSTFDNFPTTLAALGCAIRGDRLGLGTNLFSGKKTLTERLGLEEASSGVSRKSKFMAEKADINQTSQELMAREGIGPTATVRLKNYNVKTVKARLSVSDIFYNSSPVKQISAEVIQNDGTSESVTLKRRKDGSYEGTVEIPERNPEDINLSIIAHETDKKKNDTTETLFAYQGNLYLLSQNQKDFTGMLEGLNRLDHNRYDFFITTQRDAGRCLTAEQKKLLKKLGASVPDGDHAYAAVITGDGILQREGEGSITFNGMLDENTPYEVTAGDAGSEVSSSVHIGNDFTEYSPGRDGYNIVVWDTLNHSAALQYNFNTTNSGPSADVKAVMNTRTHEIDVMVRNISGIPGNATDMTAVIGNRTNTDAEKNITMNASEDKTEYTGSITLKDMNPDDLYVRVYGLGGDFKWWNLGTHSVSEKTKH